MKHRLPLRAEGSIDGRARVLHPTLVEVGHLAAGVRRPHDLRNGLREVPVAALAGSTNLGELALTLAQIGEAQRLCLLHDPSVLAEQLGEDFHLGAKQVGVERLDQVVDRAQRVGLVDVADVVGATREEDDRREPAPLPLLDDPRDLEAVDVGHHDVERGSRRSRG